MVRQFIGFTLSLVILFSILTAASTIIGRVFDTPVMLALLTPQRAGATVRTTNKVALIDLSRFLRVDHSIPLEYIQQTNFGYPSFQYLTVSTYQANLRTKEYKTGLYLYDIVTASLTDIFTAEADEPFNISNTGYYYNFFSVISHTGDRMAFIHPRDADLYLYDISTQQTRKLADLEWTGISSQAGSVGGMTTLNWSPDDSMLALKIDNRVFILKGDGSEQSQYTFEGNDFYPTWMENSRYLWIQRISFVGDPQNRPLEIIDVLTGEPHPLTKDLEVINMSWWGCENRWLSYTASGENYREGYILNLQSGETVRLNDHPLLAMQSIESVSPLTNCKDFLVSTRPNDPAANNTGMPFATRPMYVFDIATQSAEYLDEISGVIQLTEAGELYYQKHDPVTNDIQVFKRTFKPLSEPELIREYLAVDADWLSWSADLSYAIFRERDARYYAGSLNLLDAASGRIYQLTGHDEFVQNYTWLNWNDIRHPEAF